MKNPLEGVICEVCGARPAVGVASTSIPYSAAYCAACAAIGADPYWVLVANTAGIGGMPNAAEHWHEQVRVTLTHLGISREQFDRDVAADIRALEAYHPSEPENDC